MNPLECPNCHKIKKTADETCSCASVAMLGIEYPDDGYGIFSHLETYKYPYTGMPDEKLVDYTAVFKKSIIGVMRLFFSFPFFLFLPLLFFFPRNFIKKKLIRYFGEMSQTTYQNVKYREVKRCCAVAREIYRILEKIAGGFSVYNSEEQRLWKQLLYHASMGVVMMLEMDNAYRFRVQDILFCLDKEKARKNPIKEVLRLLDIAITRDNCRRAKTDIPFYLFSVSDKWKMLRWAVIIGSILFRKEVKLLKQFLLELKISEIAPTHADWYFMCERSDYEFGGYSFLERMEDRRSENKGWKFPKAQKQITMALVPSAEFFTQTREQALKFMSDLVNNFMNDFDKVTAKEAGQNLAINGK